MSGPRGRWPRPPRGHPAYRARGGRGSPQTSAGSSVPSAQQVVPGATVSIVLKEDQPTGNEVQGTVQDLLTKGNHPRGIKVRLQDGRVGRVQRMAGSTPATLPSAPTTSAAPVAPSSRPTRITKMATDVRLDEGQYLDGPPTRSLADYFPDPDKAVKPLGRATAPDGTAIISKCPICGTFEGDEWAVSRHVEEHLT
ncbi:hypothetical protein LTR17_021876 [Elasticomyces elasticus]|nr:hypothetical protein LTR17_021876 [Elasticomyces elasticus]